MTKKKLVKWDKKSLDLDELRKKLEKVLKQAFSKWDEVKELKQRLSKWDEVRNYDKEDFIDEFKYD